MPTIGLLTLQGDFREHREALARIGVAARDVRTAEALAECDALIIPGGESTTIGKLLVRFGVMEPLRRFIAAGRPVMGTCAGAILLCDRVLEGNVDSVGGLDAEISRNAYGRQIDSFERDLEVAGLERPFRAVFIRAPRFLAVGAGVEVLAAIDGEPVLVRQGALLALTFHPELTADPRIHRLLLAALGD